MRLNEGRYETILAIAILAVAAVLRFLHLGTIPLLHDEISALYRTDFNRFGELIRDGVAIDAHPAFTQVLLWIWAPIAGTDTWLLRLPIALMGWGSVVVMWRFVDVAADRFRAN